MSAVLWLLVLAGLCAAGILGVNFWARFNYRPTKAAIAQLLVKALQGSATHEELDYFISMPIRHDSKLENTRCEFAKLYGPTSFVPGSHVWNAEARDRIERLISALNSGGAV